MKTPLGAIVTEPVQPREPIEFFRSKGFAPPDQRFDYRDWWGAEHARGFVVAKAMQDDVLELIRGHVNRALTEGRTLDQFRADLAPELKRLGWWGRKDMADPVTGEWREVQLGSRRRLRVIFDTNMRTSRAAGRWARIQRTKRTLPYLQYVQIQRPSKREEHAAWHEMVMRVDHPAWAVIYPPNGYFCGCIVRQLSEGMVEREGLTVTEEPPLIMRAVPNNRTGGVDEVPVGITPGFAHNSGAAFLDVGELHGEIAAGLPAVQRGIERGLAAEARVRGLRTGVEHLGSFDLDTGDPLSWTSGSRGTVSFTAEFLAAIDDPARRIAAVHNHPSSSAFSPTDIRQLAARPGLESLIAIGHDGSIYKIARSGPSLGAAIDRAYDLAIAEISAEAARLGLDRHSAWRLVANAASGALAARGHMEYSARLAGGTRLAMERFGRGLFDDVVARIVARLEALGL